MLESKVCLESAVITRFHMGLIGTGLLHRFVSGFLLGLFFVVKCILDPLQEDQIVLTDVFLLAHCHLVTLVVKDRLEDATRVQILLFSQGHRSEEVLQLMDKFHT